MVETSMIFCSLSSMMPGALLLFLLLRAESKISLAANPKERIFTKRTEKKTKIRKKNVIREKLSTNGRNLCAGKDVSFVSTVHFLLFPSFNFSSAKIRRDNGAPSNLASH